MTHSRPQQTILYETARRLVDAAISHATGKDWTIAVAVLDPSGFVLASGRMDGVPAPVLDYAIDKGFTATLGKTSLEFGERMGSMPSLTLGLSTRDRLLAWEGGVPIREDGVLIGAIGISGAAGHEDAECAQAALRSLSLTG